MATIEDRLIDDAVDILRQRGPLTTEEWTRLMVDAGYGDFDSVFEMLRYSDQSRPLGPLVDGRHVALDVLLDGRVMTHRLTELEIAADVLDLADLSPLAEVMPLASDSADTVDVVVAVRGLDNELFADRGLTDELWPAILAIVLRPGALRDYSAGDGVALRFTDGQFTVDAVPKFDDSTALASIGSLLPDDSSTEIKPVVWQLMHDDPSLFTLPIAPLTDLLRRAGFERSDLLVAPVGYDFDAERIARQADGVAGNFGLTREDGMALLAICDVVGEVAPLDYDDAVTRAAELVRTHSDSFERVAGTRFALAVRVMGDEESDAMDALCAAMTDVLPSPFHVGALWIRSQAAMVGRRPLDAEAYLVKAVDINSSWGLAALDLARFALVRGESERGLSLLDNAEFDDRFTPVVEFIRYLLEDCAQSDASIHDRVARLVFVVHMMTFQVGSGDGVDRLLNLRTSQMGGSEETFRKVVGDPFVNDVALIEGGLLAQFMVMVGDILPAEDVALLELYGSIERSVFEVTEMSADSAITLHDRRTGLTVTAVDEDAADTLRVGDFICSRLVPVGNGFGLFGGVEPVDPKRRFQLVEVLEDHPVDPAELVGFLGGRFVPRSRRERRRRR